MFRRIVFEVFAFCLIAGCKNIQAPNAKTALGLFCEHPAPASDLASTPAQKQFCKDHFEVVKEGQRDWYVELKPQYWQRSKEGFVIGLVTFGVNKTTGKINVISVAD